MRMTSIQILFDANPRHAVELHRLGAFLKTCYENDVLDFMRMTTIQILFDANPRHAVELHRRRAFLKTCYENTL
jgi:predicted TIM-barrel enzyme